MDHNAFFVTLALGLASVILAPIAIIVEYLFDYDELLLITGITATTAFVCGLYTIIGHLLTS